MGLSEPAASPAKLSSGTRAVHVLELRFAITGYSVPPSLEVIEECMRDRGPDDVRRFEHITVRRVRQDLYIIVFALARDARDAGGLALRLGADVTTRLPQIRFSGYRVWRNESADWRPGEEG